MDNLESMNRWSHRTLQCLEGVINIYYYGEQGMAQWWERLPPTNVAQFTTRHWHHMWVEFVVGSLPYSERLPLSSKSNIFKFQFDQESGRRRATLWMCYLRIIIYLFMWYGMYRIWFGGNQEFYYKILSFLIFAGFNTGTYLTWKRTEWTQEKKLCWSSFIASGGRERIQVQSNFPCDHSCEQNTFVKSCLNCDLNFVMKSSHKRLLP